MTQNPKILLIGGITWPGTANPRFGGTTVLMDNLIDYCKDHDVPHVVIPTNKYYGKFKGIMNLLLMVCMFFRHAKRGDVAMINVSSKVGIITLFPLVYIMSKMCGMQTVCRQFAGNIHRYLDAKKYRKRIALHFLKKTKVSFFETEELLNWFKRNGYNAVWFPNVRKSNEFSVSSSYTKRFVFVAQLYEEKGVDIILRLSNRLPSDYTFDIYGPLVDPKYNDEYFSQYRANYCGVLKPGDVVSTLAQYNIMAFPTWWPAEGYPGVIIEALSVGMPVISTITGGIPEMIENGKNGLLVKVKDEEAFEKAICSVDQMTYSKLHSEAEKKFDLYNADLVNPRIIKEILK